MRNEREHVSFIILHSSFCLLFILSILSIPVNFFLDVLNIENVLAPRGYGSG
jgi:hypothetical protein